MIVAGLLIACVHAVKGGGAACLALDGVGASHTLIPIGGRGISPSPRRPAGALRGQGASRPLLVKGNALVGLRATPFNIDECMCTKRLFGCIFFAARDVL